MDSSLLIVLTVFVAICCLAMVAQAIAMFGIFRAARQIQEKLNGLLPEAAKVLNAAQTTINQTSKFVTETNARTVEILDITKAQLNKLDGVFTDAANRAKVQMERAELVLDDAMSRTQQTVVVLQKGVIGPIREVYGVLTGIRAAIAAFARGNRPTVDHATADEEMFI
ncbi:MAG: hypothetical protein WAM39_19875 [Bryobacteraceae bacterium]